jgi:CRP/FNR family cyclic AMP-dependent transcriptional regulator
VSPGSTVRLLESEPELGLRVPANQIRLAREQLVARQVTLDPGLVTPGAELSEASGAGYLVVDGVLARELVLGRHVCAELLGEGDIVQPRLTPHEDRLVPYHLQWRVLSPLRLAVLDEPLARRIGQWPGVMGAMLDRANRRTHRMAVHQALLQLSPVETRLLLMLWHLAERWGRVTPDGIVVSLRLSHELLGHLVGCRRASVTTALARVYETDRVVRRTDGRWLLRGSPPGALDELHWEPRRVAVHEDAVRV